MRDSQTVWVGPDGHYNDCERFDTLECDCAERYAFDFNRCPECDEELDRGVCTNWEAHQ